MIEDKAFNDFAAATVVKCCPEADIFDSVSQQSLAFQVEPKVQKLLRITEMELENESNFALNKSLVSHRRETANQSVAEIVPELDFKVNEL